MSKEIQLDIFRTYHKNVKIKLKVPEHLKGEKLKAHLKSPVIAKQIEDAMTATQLINSKQDFHYMDVRGSEGGYIK